MDQEVVRRRNAVFLVIYRKTTRIYPACVPRAVRWLFEALFLIMVRSSPSVGTTAVLHMICLIILNDAHFEYQIYTGLVY